MHGEDLNKLFLPLVRIMTELESAHQYRIPLSFGELFPRLQIDLMYILNLSLQLVRDGLPNTGDNIMFGYS